MTLHVDGAIGGRRFAIDDTGALVCVDCFEDFRTADEFARHARGCPGTPEATPTPSEAAEALLGAVADASEANTATASPLVRPEDNPTALPPGYVRVEWAANYGKVRAPDGRVLPDADEKFHGKRAAADAAWEDALR